MKLFGAVAFATITQSTATDLQLSWSDCGDASTHTKITSFTPASLTLGQSATMVGTGNLDEDVAGASFDLEMSGALGKLLSCKGDASASKTCQLPLGTGSLTFEALTFPLKKGTTSVKVSISLGATVPPPLYSTTTIATGTAKNGVKLFCLQIKTSKAAALSTQSTSLNIPRKEIAPGVNMPVLSIGTGGLGRKDGGEITTNWLAVGGLGIDSAQGYGNEGDVRAAIQNSRVSRSNLFITSKISSLDSAASAVESELKKLGQDYFDLLLVHEPRGDFKTGWKELEGLVQSGKLKAIGISNFKKQDIDKLLPYTTIKPAVNQIRTSVFCHDDETIAYCKEKGITVEAWSPLDGKHECSKAGSVPHDPTVVAIANAHKVSSYQVGLKWIVQHGWLTTFQSTEQSHQKEDADLFSFNLTDSEMSQLNNIQKHIHNSSSIDENESNSVTKLPPVVGKLVCELAQKGEQPAINEICQKVPLPDCQALLQKVWDQLLQKCPPSAIIV